MYGMTTAHPSNYTKGRSAPIEFLVLHYTAGRNDSAAGNLRYFASPRGASAHYFVDRDGWRQSVSDEDTLESGEIRCPNCGEKLEFDLSDLADAEDEDQE